MSIEIELKRMVIKLLGDSKDYLKTLKDAITKTKQSAAEIEKVTVDSGAASDTAIKNNITALSKGLATEAENIKKVNNALKESKAAARAANRGISQVVSQLGKGSVVSRIMGEGLQLLREALQNDSKALTGLNDVLKKFKVGIIAAKASLILFAITAGIKVAKAIDRTIEKWLGLNAAIEKNKKLTQEITDNQAKLDAKVLASFSDVRKGSEQAFLTDAIERQQRKIEGLRGSLRRLKKRAAEAKPTFLSLGQAGKRVFEEEQRQVDETTKTLEEANKQLKRLRETQGDFLAKNDRDPRFFDSEETKKKREEAAAASAAALAAEKQATEALDQAIGSTNDSLNDQITALQLQFRGVKDVSGALLRMKLENQGASKAEIDHIQALQNEKNKLVDLIKANEKQNSLIAEGKRITESLLTPQEKFNKRVSELANLQRQGVISGETFSRGVAKAKESITETEEATTMLSTSVKNLYAQFGDNRAVRAGSAELRKLLFDVAKATDSPVGGMSAKGGLDAAPVPIGQQGIAGAAPGGMQLASALLPTLQRIAVASETTAEKGPFDDATLLNEQ